MKKIKLTRWQKIFIMSGIAFLYLFLKVFVFQLPV